MLFSLEWTCHPEWQSIHSKLEYLDIQTVTAFQSEWRTFHSEWDVRHDIQNEKACHPEKEHRFIRSEENVTARHLEKKDMTFRMGRSIVTSEYRWHVMINKSSTHMSRDLLMIVE